MISFCHRPVCGHSLGVGGVRGGGGAVSEEGVEGGTVEGHWGGWDWD